MADNTTNQEDNDSTVLLIKSFIIPFFILLICSVYLLTLHEGQNWSGDFSLYIHHAKNLVEGKSYLDTHYLVNPASYSAGPYAYPPVYPLLLAPVYWFAGLDLETLKWVGVICFCIGLYYGVKAFSYRLGHWQTVAVLLIVGLNPYLWKFSNQLRSDFTFVLFCYLSLYLMIKAFRDIEERSVDIRHVIQYSLLLGLSIYLAYGTREIGVVLPLTMVTYDIICRRRISLLSIFTLSIFLLLAYVQTRLMVGDFTPQSIKDNIAALLGNDVSPGAVSQLQYLNLRPAYILKHIIGYRWGLQSFWPESGHASINLLNSVLFNLTTLVAFAGYCLALFRRITVLEIFMAGYLAVLLIFSAPSTSRYLIPLFPLVIYYLVYAYRRILADKNRALMLSPIIAYCSVTAVIYGVAIVSTGYEDLDMGVQHPQAVEMFRYIEEQTDSSDTIVFRKPRIMALLTQRTSASKPDPRMGIPNLYDSYFQALEGDYFVDMNLEGWMMPLTDSSPPGARFSEVFRNEYFAVYRFQ